MSMQSLKRQILAEAKQAFNNPKLKTKDIIQWSSSKKAVTEDLLEGEVMCQLPVGVWVCIAKSKDKREAAERTD